MAGIVVGTRSSQIPAEYKLDTTVDSSEWGVLPTGTHRGKRHQYLPLGSLFVMPGCHLEVFLKHDIGYVSLVVWSLWCNKKAMY